MGMYRHIDGVQVAAIFSPCRRYRYRLEITRRAPVAGSPLTVGAILQNPSVATTDIADKSVQFLEKLVFLMGQPQFAGANRLIIVNQFALVQTRGFAGTAADIGPDNDRHIEQAIAESGVILVAWGKSNPYTARKVAIDRMLKKQEDKLVLAGKSHPARASYRGYLSPYAGCPDLLPDRRRRSD